MMLFISFLIYKIYIFIWQINLYIYIIVLNKYIIMSMIYLNDIITQNIL